MSRASVLARARAAAEAGMVDTCLIERLAESTDLDTGKVTVTPTLLYNGRCRVQQRQAQARAEDAGEAYLLMLRLELQLPMTGTSELRPGDRVTVTESANDPDLVPRVFYVRDLAHKTDASSRRVQIEERTS